MYVTDGHNLRLYVVRHPYAYYHILHEGHSPQSNAYSATKQAMIPVSTPPMNDPPIIGAESFATCV